MTGGWQIRNCYKVLCTEGINLAPLSAAHLIPWMLSTGKSSMVSHIPTGCGGDDEWECEEEWDLGNLNFSICESALSSPILYLSWLSLNYTRIGLRIVSNRCQSWCEFPFVSHSFSINNEMPVDTQRVSSNSEQQKTIRQVAASAVPPPLGNWNWQGMERKRAERTINLAPTFGRNVIYSTPSWGNLLLHHLSVLGRSMQI